MSLVVPALAAAIARHGPVVRVVITRSAGSAPRGAGTAMLVWAEGQDGTIGGGALEFQAVAAARAMLVAGPARRAQTLPLGPALGQCCGGSVSLWAELFTQATLPAALPWARALVPDAPMPARVARHLAVWQPGQMPAEVDGWLIEGAPAPGRPVWIWGAGHVGRALIGVLAPLPDLALTWIDTAADRFPDRVADGVAQVVATAPARLVPHAPVRAEHLIATYAHDLDLALCHALLTHDFAGAGLIGSATKWARFRARLSALGHAPAQISRIACPIGDPALGKHPQAIALGVATALLKGPGQAANRRNRAG